MPGMSETTFLFHKRRPSLVVIDDFYRDPDKILRLAQDADYQEDLRFYKGLRSKTRFLLPYVKEEFERLLQTEIADWMQQPANGVFQKTNVTDPLVWHSDSQSYAAAVYLEPSVTSAGTSFWKHRGTGARLPPTDADQHNEVYSEYNLTHPNAWELVDRVGSVFNRLVIWNAQLIHSASSYEGFLPETGHARLVQLFFFNIRS